MSGVRFSPRPYSPALPLFWRLFVGSGCAALIYEVVWLQLLQLVIGSSAASLAVLLGTFMGGMCLGSILLPRFIGPRRHPLRVYALLELGTALFGILILFGLPGVQYAYTASVGHGFGGILLRSIACAICLLAPTLMMGATLPAISRWIESTPEAASWWGFFYGCNIAGGVLGCVLAGFYLLASARYGHRDICGRRHQCSRWSHWSGAGPLRLHGSMPQPPSKLRAVRPPAPGRFISPSASPGSARSAPK